MKKILSLAFFCMACFFISSCSDDEMGAQPTVVRDYQTDAQVLAKFVDINKNIGEYYINENKKNSPLAYVTNKDREELELVSPMNRTKYENDLKALNMQLAIVAQRADVSQIVYSTYGETWVRNIADDSPITFTKSTQTSTKSARGYLGRLNLLYNSEQRFSFYAGSLIRMRIDINLYSYTYYFYEIICNNNASKSGSSAGGDDPKRVIMSGTTSMESWEYTWTENSGSSNVYWTFRGKKYAPQEIGATIIAEFSN